jgi:solute:Na+ symporter, SSS family
MGGMEAVIWTEVVQVIVMMGGALWVLAAIFWQVSPTEVVSIAWEAGGKFDLGQYSLRWDGQTFLGVFLFGIFSNLQNFGIDQNYIQRYHTARSEPEARRAVLIAVVPYVPVTALFLMIGTALFAFYRVFPDLLPAGVTGDMVFPHFIQTQLPAGVKGLLVAAIMAAAMSTISSNLNCMATVFAEDIVRKRWAYNERQHVILLRSLTLMWGLMGTFTGLAMMGSRSGIDLFWQITAITGSGLLGIFLLGVFVKSARPVAVKWAAAGTVLFVMYGSFQKHLPFLPEALRFTLDPLLVGVLGTLGLITVAAGLSRLLPAPRTGTAAGGR